MAVTSPDARTVKSVAKRRLVSLILLMLIAAWFRRSTSCSLENESKTMVVPWVKFVRIFAPCCPPVPPHSSTQLNSCCTPLAALSGRVMMHWKERKFRKFILCIKSVKTYQNLHIAQLREISAILKNRLVLFPECYRSDSCLVLTWCLHDGDEVVWCF